MASKKNKSGFEAALSDIDRQINSDPAKAYNQLADLKKNAQNEQERLTLYCDVLMGRCLQRQGKGAEAFDIISVATGKLASISAPRETAMGYHYMSQICILNNDVETAHEYCVRGLLLAEESNDWYAQMCLRIDMSPIYNHLQDYEACLSIYLESKDIFEKHVRGKEPAIAGNEDYTAFIIDMNIAFYYKKTLQYDKALYQLNLIADTAETMLDGMYLDKFHIEYASICMSLDKIDLAKEHVDRIIDLLQKKEQTFSRIVPNNYLALCQQLVGKGILDRAGIMLDILRDTAQKEGNSYFLKEFYNTSSRYYSAIGDYQKAIENFILFADYVDIEDGKKAESSKQNVRRRTELAKQRDELEMAFKEGKRDLAAAETASAAKGTFLSRMSHEIRTPLNAIIGYNEIAYKALSEPQDGDGRNGGINKALDCLTKCNIASRHLLTVINDVLDVSAIESGKIKLSKNKFDFKAAINSLTTVFYPQAAKRGIKLEIVLGELDEEWFVGDALRVTQILTNLLSNAIKFTPEGGGVTMSVAPTQFAKKTLFHIEVSDTGIGMSEEYLARIWTPFEQADETISRRFGGTGLGMTITKTLVDLMGGTIEVKSELGKGTTFYVDIDLERTEQPKTNADVLTKDESFDFLGARILLAEDNEMNMEIAKTILSSANIVVDEAANGQQAVDMFCSSAENYYGLVLMDVQMPIMDGHTATRAIRASEHPQAKNIPIIAMTADAFAENVAESMSAGMNDHVSKPFEPKRLFEVIAKHLSK